MIEEDLEENDAVKPALDEPENPPETESLDGEYVLKEYEDYGGYINGEPSDDYEWMGMIADDAYKPLENCGPQVIIEDEIDESGFLTLDLNENNDYTHEQLFALDRTAKNDTSKVDIHL
ncbi:hypothetical protein L218DRAFT_1010651 [Marasmius fiardii PR-910]|nr:hypothetical protein L218DRAFT_1010651 [Marasmius fiardii PR-910]